MFLEHKLMVFDNGHGIEESEVFKNIGFRWRFAFDYLSPNVESMLLGLFNEKNIQVQRNPSNEFSFVWIKDVNKSENGPAAQIHKKGVKYLTVRDLYQKNKTDWK